MTEQNANFDIVRRETDKEIARIYQKIDQIEHTSRESIQQMMEQMTQMNIALERMAVNFENFQAHAARPCPYHDELRRDFIDHMGRHKETEAFIRGLFGRVLGVMIIAAIGAGLAMWASFVAGNDKPKDERKPAVERVEGEAKASLDENVVDLRD